MVLHGKKLKGEFALVKMKGGREENAWLLIKHNDKYAVHDAYDSEDFTPKSVVAKLKGPHNTKPEAKEKVAPPKKKAAAKKTAPRKSRRLRKLRPGKRPLKSNAR